MSYLARSSSSEMPASSASRNCVIPEGAGSARGAPSIEVPCAAARSRASGSQESSPMVSPSRGPAPGAWGKRPAFSSALRTSSSSAAPLSTSACDSGSSASAASAFSSGRAAGLTGSGGTDTPEAVGTAVTAEPSSPAAAMSGAGASARAVAAARSKATKAAFCGRPDRGDKLLHLSLTERDGSGAPTLCQNSRTGFPLSDTCRQAPTSPRNSASATMHGRQATFQAFGRCRRPRGTPCPAGYRTIPSGLQFFDEFAHAAPGVGGALELGDVSAAGDQLHSRSGDVPPEVLGAGRGQQPILLSPEDEHRRADRREHVDAERTVAIVARVVEDALHRRAGPPAGEVPRHQPEQPGRTVEEQLRHARRARALLGEALRQHAEGLLGQVRARRIEADHARHLVGAL